MTVNVSKSQPLVSVIVTTKNEEKRLGALLESLLLQTYPNLEIIVVDNASSDATKAIAAKFTEKVFDKGPERSAQRNYGVKQSLGQYVLILDADMELTPSVVADCVDLLQANPTVKAAIIPEESFGEGFWAKCKALERSCYVGDDSIEAARFFEKAVYDELGGFDEGITGPEDWDLSRRVGSKYKIGRIKSFILHNEGNLKLTTLMRKKRMYARKAGNYLNKHRQSIASSQTIYFLRPAFYRNWRKLLAHPVTFGGMVFMLSAEFGAAGMGFVETKLKK